MKTVTAFFCIGLMCISAGFLRAQDSVPPPPGYGGGQENVPPPPGYGGGMMGGMAGGMGMGANVEQAEFSNTVSARCLLKVSCDPSILRLDYPTMTYLWRSTGVLNKAYREILEDSNSLNGLDADSSPILLVDGSRAPAEMVYAVAIPMGMGAKEKLILAAAVDNLKSTLSRMENGELEKLRDRLNQINVQCMDTEGQVAQMQKQVRAITEETGITSRDEVQKRISGLRDSVMDMDMRIQYSEARIKQLNEQKDKLRAAIDEALTGDTAANELRELVRNAELLVTQCEQGVSAGRFPAEKVQEAKEKLARARIEMAKRMEEVREKAGQTRIADIDDQIGKMASEISEVAMGKEFKRSLHVEAKKQLEKSDELELLEMKLDAAKRSFREVLNAREDLKARLQTTQKLSVSVIGME